MTTPMAFSDLSFWLALASSEVQIVHFCMFLMLRRDVASRGRWFPTPAESFCRLHLSCAPELPSHRKRGGGGVIVEVPCPEVEVGGQLTHRQTHSETVQVPWAVVVPVN